MADYDFYSPYVSVAAVTAEGDRIPFWTNTTGLGQPSSEAATALKNAGVYSIPYVSSVSVTLNLGELPVIEVGITPPYNDALAMLDSTIVEWGRTSLEVQFGYTGGAPQGNVLSPVFSGLMTQPEISVGEEMSITFKAHGAFSLASDSRNKTWKGMRRLDLFYEFLQGVGEGGSRNIELDASEATFDSVTGPLLSEKLESFTASYRTDWDLINLLAQQCRCWALMIDNSLKLIPRTGRLSGPATRIFSLFNFPGGRMGPQAGVFPILSFSTSSSAIYYPGVLKGLANGGVNSANRKAEYPFFDGTTVRPALVGTGNGLPKASPQTPGVANRGNDATPKDGAVHMFADINDPTMRDKMSAEYERLITGLGIDVKVTSLGLPDLRPGDVIALRGLGKRIDGNYGVFSVTHTLGTDGFTTQFDGFSNTSKLGEQYATAPDSTPGNTVEVQVDDGVNALPIDGGVLS